MITFRILRVNITPTVLAFLFSLAGSAAQQSDVKTSSSLIQSRELQDANRATKTAVIFLFGGIAAVGGLMAITYLVTLIMDKISPPDGSSVSLAAIAAHRAALEAQMRNTPDGEGENRLDRKANLWGLLMFERELILTKIFPTMSFDYDVKEIVGGTENMSVLDTCGDIEMADVSSATKADELDEDVLENATADASVQNEQTQSNVEFNENVLENALKNVTDHFRMCCICLAPYENGIRVMVGAQCKHMFHDTCCQRWLLQHDHCPYCRKEMILPTDFRNAAVAVLGKDRVDSISVPSTELPNPSPVP